MPFYNVYFDTTQGELQYKVPIADDATIGGALPDLLTELQEKGYRLKGGSSDTVQVLWNGRPLRGAPNSLPRPAGGAGGVRRYLPACGMAARAMLGARSPDAGGCTFAVCRWRARRGR